MPVDIIVGFEEEKPICMGLETGGQPDYKDLKNKPIINEEIVEGVKEGKDYSLQDRLIPGEGIEIIDNGDHTATIKATGGSGIGELAEDLEVSNPIGRYKMNDVIDKGTGFETIFRGLLSKTYYPALTDPSVAISYGAPALMKVGAYVQAQQATITFNRGSINPKYTADSPYRSGEATRYAVSLAGASVEYSDSKITSQFNIPAFTRNSTGNVVLNAAVDYAAGVQPKDSDGNDYLSPLPAGSKSAGRSIEFILPFYWGSGKSPALSDLSNLTEDLSRKGQKKYTYMVDNDYCYIVYDASYGDLRSILDENNFENIDSWNKGMLTYGGQSYIIYTSGFALTGAFPFTFSF